MQKQIVAVDIDGVVIDFVGAFLTFLRQEKGIDVLYQDVLSHDVAKALNIPQDVFYEHFNEFSTEERVRRLPCIYGAAKALQMLSSNFELIALTGRPKLWQAATQLCFEDRHILLPIHFAHGRNNIASKGEDRIHKPQVAEALGAQYLIEDNEDEFLHWDSDTVKPLCLA